MYVLYITDDYDNMTLTNCTNNESITDFITPSLLLTIPCGLSFLCLMSLMVFTLFKPLFNNKRLRNFYTHHIQSTASLSDPANVVNQSF